MSDKSVKLALLCRDAKSLTRLPKSDWEVVEFTDLAPRSPNNWETGWWVMNPSKVSELIGCSLILTEGRNKDAYLGGVITGFRVEVDEEQKMALPETHKNLRRVCLQFTEDYTLRGNTEHIGNWESRNPVRYLGGGS